MKRYILTGTPGCGKTSILHALSEKGYEVIPEAATDVIKQHQLMGIEEPWKNPVFIEKIVQLQRDRQTVFEISKSELQFYDRSPICTYALAVYLDFSPSKELLEEVQRIKRLNIYEKEVFFIENLGFCETTEARKISFDESLIFEKIHNDAYKKLGFQCIKIPPKPVQERAESILSFIHFKKTQ